MARSTSLPNGTPGQYRPQPLHHDGSCGLRFRTECCGDRFDPFLTGEALRNGDCLCHGCRRLWRATEPWQLGRIAA